LLTADFRGGSNRQAKASSVVPVYQPKQYPFGRGPRELVYHASWNGLISVGKPLPVSYNVGMGRWPKILQRSRRKRVSSKALGLYLENARTTITSKIDANGLTPTRFTFQPERKIAKSLIPSRVFGPDHEKHGRCIEMIERRFKRYQFRSNRTIRLT